MSLYYEDVQQLLQEDLEDDDENVEFENISIPPDSKSPRIEDDPVLDTIGNFGPYQLWLCFLGFCLTIVHSWQSLSLKFVGMKPKFRCAEGDDSSNQWETGSGIRGCTAVFGNNSRPCQKFIFDQSEVQSSIVQRWSLVCDNAGLENVAQSVFFSGGLVGVFLAGVLADKIGRKSVCLTLVLTFLITAVLGGLVNRWWVWLGLRFIVGAASIGMTTVRYTIQVEMIGSNWRTWANTISSSGWVVGYMTLPVLAYTIPNMKTLEVFIGFAVTPFLFMYWCHPDSPKWLITDKQYKKAATILNSAAAWNGRTEKVPVVSASSLSKKSSSLSEDNAASFGLSSIFNYPALTRNLIAMAICWFAFGMAYFGLALHTPEFGSSVFLVFFIGGLMDVPVTLFGPILLNWGGRKPCLVGGLLIGAVCLLITVLIPPGIFYREWPVTTLAIVGKLGMGLAFDTGYIWTTEIFPTVIRNSALAVCSSFARAGAIVAPLMSSIDQDQPKMPIIIYGLVSLVAGFVSLTIQPETRGSKHLPDTMEEGENWSSKKTVCDKKRKYEHNYG